ncbi:MAG: HEPN domain-containing protein [Armatimonadota bacterium]
MRQPDAVGLWMQLADRDLQKARRLAEPPPFPEGVCFYAQQAAEKALKAYCCALGAERVPRTHDLVELAELVEQLGGEAPRAAPLELLSRYAVAARYEVPIPAPDDAEEALQMAEDLCAELLEPLTGNTSNEDAEE